MIKWAIAMVLAIEVFLFAMVPYFSTSIASNKKLMKLFNTFSAGLFLGISFLHIIPEANESISRSQESLHSADHIHQEH